MTEKLRFQAEKPKSVETVTYQVKDIYGTIIEFPDEVQAETFAAKVALYELLEQMEVKPRLGNGISLWQLVELLSTQPQALMSAFNAMDL